MIDDCFSMWLRLLGGEPCFRIQGKAKRERGWRTIGVYATARRNAESRWPLWRGTCITWTSEVIVIGWDFAAEFLSEQMDNPASREHPVEVAGGRINDLFRRAAAGVPNFASCSEVLAHECGHTWQALRLGSVYLPIVGSTTLFQEGPHPWNRFENEASEQGLMGGLVNGSVCPRLAAALASKPARR